MIEFTKSYKTADGQVFGTIEDAQKHEIEEIFNNTRNSQTPSLAGHGEEIANVILVNKHLLIDVLTTTPNSKPKARSIHGGTKTRKKTVVTDANISAATGVNVVSPDDGNHNF